ncbi:MAG: hypothetical protein AAF502_06220 [Bacteroidota bacterium]
MENKTIKNTEIRRLSLKGEDFFQITNVDELRPFFMSIVSDANHWMFISSNGGLSAGRKNAENALFPYYTDDKITESAEITGSKSIFLVHQENKGPLLWEPFSIRQEEKYMISRHLYKNIYGNKVLFEEINHDLKLTFRYQWNSSNRFGFVRKSEVLNDSDNEVQCTFLDGIQNIVPAGVGSDLQNQSSNLVDAYKRSELVKTAGIGIFALSAIIVDKAEPSESLKATIAWSLGIDNPIHLLSSLQLKRFRKNQGVREESDVKAEKGAFFVSSAISLPANKSKEWIICAEVNMTHTTIVELAELKKDHNNLKDLVEKDIKEGTKKLIQLVASSDGIQNSSDLLKDVRHYSNTLFNIMRGGIFDKNYQIEKWDFSGYLSNANQVVFQAHSDFVNQLPERFTFFELKAKAEQLNDPDLKRLCLEYLPLNFSRRHGDPSRPWNKFTINTQSETDGSKILDYEGNWRDIFQNWEALVYAFPGFVECMVLKFLNASTFEGYNPYRVTKDGFDWEVIEPDNPWSYIGYWGDHQIIYLLKFLEFFKAYSPSVLRDYFDKEIFVYANVPYKIKPFEDILSNPKDTIEFDEALDHEIGVRKRAIGADGALLKNQNGEIHRVSFMEKLLATLLSKISNFIPEGGIWMNTQRPEWNDANNALVGNGVSMVTLYYIRRFLVYFKQILADLDVKSFDLSEEFYQFFKALQAVLESHKHLLSDQLSDNNRGQIVNELGEAGSNYRAKIYSSNFSGGRLNLSLEEIRQLVDLCIEYTEHTIDDNQRNDKLFHAYNLMSAEDGGVSIDRLNEMLEGQVAVLSSGYLSGKAALEVLNGLKNSKLFRDDQYSYLLYPNKALKGFMERNIIPEAAVKKSELLTQLLEKGSRAIVEKDINGKFHFHGSFKNANDLEDALDQLANTKYGALVNEEKHQLLQMFEDVFNHKAFTGRSGTFYGYEGLGSIYWHMVSKLLLAVQECCLKAIENNEDDHIIGGLLEHYYEINEGIGVHKSPSLYGAFPTDPYSHTPAGKGAQQPGMTGQVKEDLLCRYGELGIFIREGRLLFNPCLLKKSEFLRTSRTVEYFDVDGVQKRIEVEAGSLCFTYCQVPVVYQLADKNQITIFDTSGNERHFDGLNLSLQLSKEIFERKGSVDRIVVQLNRAILK